MTSTARPTERRQPPVVLVVGDAAGTVEVLRRLLTRLEVRAVMAPDAAAGLEVAASQLPRVVVVDLAHAGVGSTLQLLDWLRAHDDPRVASARVLVLESHAQRELLLASGADVHLDRPVHGRELLDAVEHLLRPS